MEEQLNNPLHGKKLEQILNELVEFYGWDHMSREIQIRCFYNYPTIGTSLKFLRRTPWARTKVEELYLIMLAEKKK